MTQRARTDEDKQTRRGDILDAARGVFDATEIGEFTMDSVACSLGLAKGTLYRYVPTREALLLALATDEYSAWFDHIDDVLPTASGTSAIVDLIVDSVLDRPRFMRLMSMVASVLERNVPYDTARDYKMFVIERTSTTSATLAERLGCSLPRAQQLLVHLHVVATGWSHHAHPAPIITEVLADPALSPMRRDLRTELRHAVAALVAAAMAGGAR